MTPSKAEPKYPATHPVWRLLNLVVILTFMTCFLYLNETKFDMTELWSIIYMAGGVGGWELLKSKTGAVG